ncbi:GTP-binding protein [Pseudomonas sp. MF7453]|uniref:GTP-binding protein n=1 Tax=Pseudomonas sp. MF7453 TaxID=2797539 RepID=UPI0018E866FB|nr:GTP-binding protein [Pseudomonas sp. MF7453]MBJ2219582.1 hypothetical protein [Pseudomonas sp. MF7453]
MPMHVITGPRGSGKTRRIRALHAELQKQGLATAIITGNACTTPYLVARIQQQADSGAHHFLADDCTREQIKAVQNIDLPDHFTLYLVRQA